jgi:hypothetical protein
MTENKEHDKLFADLDALTEQQIEVGLAADVWNERVRPLVQHYLYDLKLKRVEAAAPGDLGQREAEREKVSEDQLRHMDEDPARTPRQGPN